MYQPAPATFGSPPAGQRAGRGRPRHVHPAHLRPPPGGHRRVRPRRAGAVQDGLGGADRERPCSASAGCSSSARSCSSATWLRGSPSRTPRGACSTSVSGSMFWPKHSSSSRCSTSQTTTLPGRHYGSAAHGDPGRALPGSPLIVFRDPEEFLLPANGLLRWGFMAGDSGFILGSASCRGMVRAGHLSSRWPDGRVLPAAAILLRYLEHVIHAVSRRTGTSVRRFSLFASVALMFWYVIILFMNRD